MKKKLVKSGSCSKLQPATPQTTRTLTRCSTVNAVAVNPAKDAHFSGSVSEAPMTFPVSPVIQPRGQHPTPFNISLSKEEVAVGKAVIDEVFGISSLVLCGLDFLRTRGYVSPHGVEVSAWWSPGDLGSAVEDAQVALVRLDELNQRLYKLCYGALPKKCT